MLGSSPPPIQRCLFFFNFLLTVCIIGLQLVFSIWVCGKIGSLSILSASASRCLVCIQWLGICIRICTACTVVSFPIWFVDVFGWFAWRRGCEINRGRARAEHIMIVNTNLDSVSKMNWEWNKTFTYTRSIWCWQKKGCRYEFSWCNPKLLWPLVFQTDLSWLLGIGWYRLGYRWAIPRIQYVKFAQSFLHFWYSIIHWFIGVTTCEWIYMQISCSSF